MRSILGATLCSAMVALAALSAPSFAQHPTKKAGEDQWRALKAANQTTETQKAYVEKCYAGTVATQPAPAAPAQPAPARPAATTTAPPVAPAAQQPAPVRPAARTSPATTATAPASGSQFADEAQAKARCPSDTVVWVNTDSKIYHFAGHSDYGKTKQGKFMCEREAQAGNFRAAKNEKHP
jgi:type IV secretory pathway VirB10-like protein